jgi:translation initiation factor 3 subunit C
MIFKEELENDTAEIAYMVLQNMYFMSNEFLKKIKKSTAELQFAELADEGLLEEYVRPILQLNDEVKTTKTLLYLIYNHAVNRRDKAKELLMMTDLSETMSTRDYSTQICFNRALVQLGISAFHQGSLYETQQILGSVCSLGKNRD